jgi:hypothetical protein
MQILTMAATATPLHIRSQYGFLRDLIPIYSAYQLAWNVGLFLIIFVLLRLLFPTHWEVGPFLGGIGGSLAVQFGTRPAIMLISPRQAAMVEEVLSSEGHYQRSPEDGRWRPIKRKWWLWWPHYFIEIQRAGNDVRVIATIERLRSIKAYLEARPA